MSEAQWQPFVDEDGREGFAIENRCEGHRLEVLRDHDDGWVMIYANDGNETVVRLSPSQWAAMRRLDLFGEVPPEHAEGLPSDDALARTHADPVADLEASPEADYEIPYALPKDSSPEVPA